MDGEQGALNHALAGDFSTAIADIEKSLGNIFKDDVVPSLKAFIEMFTSDFGSQALSLAGDAVGQLVDGASIQVVAADIMPKITAAAVTDAEKDGTVVLNALRVQLTAVKAS